MRFLARPALWLLIVMGGVVSAVGPCGAADPVTVTDLAGRTVKIAAPPERIVCLSSGTLRLLCFLQATDKVVGVEEFEKTRPTARPYIMAYPELKNLPSIGPGGPASINREPDLEAVLKVKPDLIFISYMERANLDAFQAKVGIPVVALSSGRFASLDEKIYESLRVAGKIMGKADRAEEVINFIEGLRADLKKRTADAPEDSKPSVYAGAVGYKGVQGLESTEGSFLPLEWTGAKNLAKTISKTDHLFVDKEKILEWNPDVIFVDAGGLSVVTQDMEKNPKYYQGLKAFTSGKAYLLYPFNYYTTNAGTAILDAYAVGKILYPDRFTDVNLKETADRIYSFLLGKPLYDAMAKDFGELGRPPAAPKQ
jgi:iron complex transport system substrate-binding protein